MPTAPATSTAPLPVNYRKQNHSREAIDRAVQYAITVADGYLAQWATFSGRSSGEPVQRPLAGVRVLELGPGATLGIPVLLACAGAHMAVSDRFLASWDAEFHRPFFEELLRRVESRGARFGEPIRHLLRRDTFTAEVVESFDCGAEALDRIGRRFDLVLSNAVLEHVEDLQVTAASLARVTVPGGFGFHQVDFRDHRNFDAPLEYLTMSDEDFATMRRECFCECGCRWRVTDVAATFDAAGFDVRTFVNLHTTPEYLSDVRPRLQAPFAALPDAELLATSALFVTSRRDASRR
jgi:SAM-dependent methyltransferase